MKNPHEHEPERPDAGNILLSTESLLTAATLLTLHAGRRPGEKIRPGEIIQGYLDRAWDSAAQAGSRSESDELMVAQLLVALSVLGGAAIQALIALKSGVPADQMPPEAVQKVLSQIELGFLQQFATEEN